MHITIATPDEFAPLGDLAVAAYLAVPGMDRHVDHIDELRDLETRAQHNVVFVARLDERLAGMVVYVPGPDSPLAEFDDPDAAGIRALAVDPAMQGQGVGRRLTERCIRQARVDGRARIVLHTTAELVGAHRLYSSMGFLREQALDFDDEGTLLMGYTYGLA